MYIVTIFMIMNKFITILMFQHGALTLHALSSYGLDTPLISLKLQTTPTEIPVDREQFDPSIARRVIHSKKTSILDSRVDVQHLATKLRESEAISKPVHSMVFDESINISTYQRCAQLIDYVEKSVALDGGQFDTLLQVFRECGEVSLADELQQCYSKLH